MSLYKGIPEWRENIFLVDSYTPVLGGEVSWQGDIPTTGYSNAAVKNLTDRTLFLKGEVERALKAVEDGVLSKVSYRKTPEMVITGDGTPQNPLEFRIDQTWREVAWTRGNNTYSANNFFRSVTEVENPTTAKGAVNRRTLETSLEPKANSVDVNQKIDNVKTDLETKIGLKEDKTEVDRKLANIKSDLESQIENSSSGNLFIVSTGSNSTSPVSFNPLDFKHSVITGNANTPLSQLGDIVLLGSQSRAYSGAVGAVSVGKGASSSEESVAVGTQADAFYKESVSLGAKSSIGREKSIAIGHSAVAGSRANPTSGGAIALGASAEANNLNSVAIGREAKADDNLSVALGYRSSTNKSHQVSLAQIITEESESRYNYRKLLSGLRDPEEIYDAVNLKHLNERIISEREGVDLKFSNLKVDLEGKIGEKESIVEVDRKIGEVRSEIQNSTNSPSVVSADSVGNIAYKDVSKDRRKGSVYSGNAGTVGNHSVILGSGAESSPLASNVISLGREALSNTYGVSVGVLSKAGISSVAIGQESQGDGLSVAIGAGSKALNSTEGQSTAAVAIGNSSNSSHELSVALGSGSATNSERQVSVGDQVNNLYRRISFLEDPLEQRDAATKKYVDDKSTALSQSLNTKVDKVSGKGLSTNDFTTTFKNKIEGLSTVASTGSYNDLSDRPTIPSPTPTATTTRRGTVMLATSQDAAQGTDDTKAITPLALATVIQQGGTAPDALVKGQNLADLPNKTTARSNLGLGTAAIKNVGEASGNVMEVGAFGLGSSSSPSAVPTGGDVRDIGNNGFYRSGSSDLGKPEDSTGVGIIKFGWQGASWSTLLMASPSTDKMYFHNTQQGVHKGWREFYHTGNFDPSTKVDNTRQVIAGNGMTGGGTLGANRTITLGIPSTVTSTATNSVSSTSHTHELGADVKSSLAKADSAIQAGDFGIGSSGAVSVAEFDEHVVERGIRYITTGVPSSGNIVIGGEAGSAGGVIYVSRNGEIFSKGRSSSVWGDWRKLWDDSNFSPESKQDKLTAGTNIQINANGTISATNTTYTTGSLAQLNTGTETTGRLQSAKNLNEWLNGKLGGKLSYVEGSEKIGIEGDGTSANPYVINFLYGDSYENLSLGLNSVSGMHGTALGTNTNASHLNSVALGRASTTTKNYQVSIAQLAQSTNWATNPRLLSGVANPEANQDAVNLQTFKPTGVFAVRTDSDMIRYLIDRTFSPSTAILNYTASEYNLSITSDNITHLDINAFNRRLFKTHSSGINFNIVAGAGMSLTINGFSVSSGKTAKVTYPGNRIFEVFSQRPTSSGLFIDFGPLAEVTIT